jgi:hypothetical protein
MDGPALGRLEANGAGEVFVAAEDEGCPALESLLEHVSQLAIESGKILIPA